VKRNGEDATDNSEGKGPAFLSKEIRLLQLGLVQKKKNGPEKKVRGKESKKRKEKGRGKRKEFDHVRKLSRTVFGTLRQS